jgi:tetratricopeptide (TPR) repeat protein
MAELGEVKRKIAEFEVKGDTDKAIKELEKAIKAFPKEGSLFNKLGDLYLKNDRQKDALETYEKGARIFKEETYFPNAIALCKKILRLDKNCTEVYGLLGELHKELDQRGEAANYLLEYADRKMKENELEVALHTYNTIKELVPNNVKILQTISAIYEQMGKKDEADAFIKEAEKILSEQGKLRETLTAKVEVVPDTASKTNVEEAVKEEVKEAVKEEVKEEIKEEIAETVNEKMEPEEAGSGVQEIKVPPDEEIEKEISSEETVSPAVDQLKEEEVQGEEISVEATETVELSEIERTVELGELYLSLGSEDEAIDCFRNAALSAWNKKDYDQAMELNKKIAGLRPFDIKSRQQLVEINKLREDKGRMVKSMLDLAETLNRRDAKSEARALYEKILEIDPKNVTAKEMLTVAEHPKDFIDLGEVLRTELEEEKKVGAVQSIDELISEFRREVFESIGEGDYRSHYDLGVAYKGMGLFQEAIEEFEIASKDENLKLKAIEMIGSCFFERDKIEDALRVLNEGLKVSNRPAQEYFGIHFHIGRCYEKEGNLTKALKAYIQAYNIDKKVPDLINKINKLKNELSAELEKRGRSTKSRKPKTSKPVKKKSKITYL